MRPGASWRYNDDAGVLGGVTKASLKLSNTTRFKLKARNAMLGAADLPTTNLVLSVSKTTGAMSHAMRNTACVAKTSRRKCRA